MKRIATRSLAVRIAWRLCLLQVLILTSAMVFLAVRLEATPSYTDNTLSQTLLSAIEIDGSQLAVADTPEVHRIIEEEATLWFAAADEEGRTVRHGQVPPVYQALLTQLHRLEPSEVHPDALSADLAMAIVVQQRNASRIHLMVGGASRAGTRSMFLGVVGFLGPLFVLPIVLLTVIAVPMVILRSMRGVKKMARHAARIDIARDNKLLDDTDVPQEIQPLVDAFNKALERLHVEHLARDRFLIDAAHELRVPIAILETRMGAMPDGQLKVRLLTDLARLSNIAEQLLDLQRLGHPDMVLVPVDLVALVRDVAADIAPLAVAAGYDLSFEAPHAERVMAAGHAPSLSRVLTNLIQNAIVHAGGRGMITVTVRESGSLEVKDEGPGLGASEEPLLFEPFYRANANGPGNGLGLYLAREIIDRHGGRIIASSPLGGGALFEVELRLASSRSKRV